ncbi:MAG: 2-C-methyl-D-erythritol 2,4-cyclodiphosphate synthase [Clostridia bacterium]|nr:2-C-methyl-D-erythritol 2,4-cyclodiphosphate synthase [Clostridia bacterium]
MSKIRIGHGYDVHRLVPGRKLIIGGVDIPFETGLLGHSDADVLSHAIADALLGAAGEKDIGFHFPDSEDKYEGISSLEILRSVKQIIKSKGAAISNIDATIVIQQPKMMPYIEKMKENIASALEIPTDDVNIKATTEEHLGFTGCGDGAAAHAVCIIYM